MRRVLSGALLACLILPPLVSRELLVWLRGAHGQRQNTEKWPVTEFELFERTAAGEPICPKCGRCDRTQRFAYGLYLNGLPKGSLGAGCSVSTNSPDYRCGHCGTNFGVTPLARRE
ncbi:MAG: hypothetical protein K2V38_17160 [Gemmataceae bacterium]|nr:hypothetical protein [Gemmataceae bacterium]